VFIKEWGFPVLLIIYFDLNSFPLKAEYNHLNKYNHLYFLDKKSSFIRSTPSTPYGYKTTEIITK